MSRRTFLIGAAGRRNLVRDLGGDADAIANAVALTRCGAVANVARSQGSAAVEWFAVALRIYRQVFRRTVQLAARNWAVLLGLFAYAAILHVAALALVALGIAHGPFALFGSLALNLLRAVCAGSFLYLIEMIVRTGAVSLEDFQRSIGAYVWDVVTIMFALWVVGLVAAPILGGIPNGWAYWLLLQFVLFVFLNAAPELIYLGHFPGLSLLAESYRFIATNWVEWFPATLAAIAIAYLAIAAAHAVGLPWLADIVVLPIFFFTMVLRGLLFLELYESNPRSRAFRYRAGGR